MSIRFLAVFLIAAPLVAQPAAQFSWGPALYTLRATDKVGTTLVLLNEKGQETVIERDERTAAGGGLMSSVPFHCSFIGAFTATADLSTVVYTKHGKAKAPFTIGIGGFSGGAGGMIGYTAAFGEHDFEGFYVWDRTSGKSSRIWDQDGLIDQLKAWKKSPEGAAFSAVDVKDEVRAHRPASLYHLEADRFAWVTGGSVLELNLRSKTARILFSDLGQGATAVGGFNRQTGPGAFQSKAFSLAFSQKSALSSANQNPDGSLFVTRPGMLVQIPVVGEPKVLALPEGHRTIWRGPENLVVSDGETIRTYVIRTGKPTEEWSLKQANSILHLANDRRSLFVYKHYKLKEDTLSKVSGEGKLLWTSKLGDCKFGILVAEAGDKVHALVRRSGGEVPIRMVLSAETGALQTQDVWIAGERLEAANGGVPAIPELADRAVLIPTAEGCLVWAPSRGEIDGTPTGSWGRDGSSLKQVGMEAAADGQWCLLTPQLVLKPLARRPLADQMTVLSQDRMQPVMNWINAGIVQSSNPGDRPMASINKKPLPFFLRDYGFWAAPPLQAFARQATTGSVPTLSQ